MRQKIAVMLKTPVSRTFFVLRLFPRFFSSSFLCQMVSSLFFYVKHNKFGKYCETGQAKSKFRFMVK